MLGPRLQAVKIEKIMNARLYDKYMTAVSDMEGLYRETGCEPVRAFPHLRVHPACLPTGRVDVNEHFAFHGATEEVLEQICKAGPTNCFRSRKLLVDICRLADDFNALMSEVCCAA